jgi:bacterial/archaeal transporter family protein
MKASIPKWLRYALFCIFWWGVFGFLAKLGSDRTSPGQMQILFTIGMLPLAAAAVWSAGMKVETDRLGVFYAVLIGVLAGLGGVAYFAAMENGKASLVGPVTSLFPLLTVVLAVTFLKERMNRIQVAGIILGLIAIAILSA